jgi:hypothetical protein
MGALGLQQNDSLTLVPKSRQRSRIRQDMNQIKFLAAFSVSGSIIEACRWSGTSRESHFRWMRDDPTYPPRFAEAEKQSTRTLEDEAVRRAKNGIEEPILYKGKPVYVQGQPLTKLTYDTTSLWKLLEARAPEKYKRDSKIDISVQTQADRIGAKLAEVLTPDQLAALETQILEYEAKKKLAANPSAGTPIYNDTNTAPEPPTVLPLVQS